MAQNSNVEKNDFYIVGIGASAGGLDAIQELFDNLPADTGMAFVIVQHLSPNFKSLMDELLAKHTSMPIYLASDGVELKPNTIYLNPKDKNIMCREGKIIHLDRDQTHQLNLPIDIFFHSLGNDIEHRAIGIILSGTGTDGSRGITTIKRSGGIVIAQDPGSAQFDGMPVTAINSNMTDFVLNPGRIAEELVRISEHPSFFFKEFGSDKNKTEDYYYQILEILFALSDIDFRLYKPNTLIRRIEKRMTVKQIKEIKEYFNFIKLDKEEQEILMNDCLIGVTAFFRDVEVFNQIKKIVLPDIFKNTVGEVARFWVSPCSTGEEAYSLAILIDEYLKENKLNQDYKIFATDADAKALQIASNGKYPVNLLADISSDRVEQYFVKNGNQYEIVKKLREKIVFSAHNLLKDPPFIKLNFASCRNLLIYLQPKSQRKVLNTFQFALNKNGYLILGNSESLGEVQAKFEAVDAKWRIYKSISEVKSLPSFVTLKNSDNAYPFRNQFMNDAMYSVRTKMLPENVFNKNIAKELAPACVYIDKDYNVLFINGDVNDFMSIRPGYLQQDFLKMLADDKLTAMVRNGIRRMQESAAPIIFSKVIYEKDKKQFLINLKFSKVRIENYADEVTLIVFEKISEKIENSVVFDQFKLDEFSRQRIEDLEDELKRAHQETQNVIEELETSNEELQASNEELQASNEELQSTNEELQSVNEELYTVNAELQAKNRELSELNLDMNNLLNSTNVATLFIDKELCIRKFTPELRKIFALEDRDINRPIDSFASRFTNISGKELAKDVMRVILSGITEMSELIDESNNIYQRKIMPFITNNNVIDGAVITFIDITESLNKKRASDLLAERLGMAISMAKLAWWDYDYTTGKVIFSDSKATMLGYQPSELSGDVYDFTKMIHPEDYNKAMKAMKDHLEGKTPNYEVTYRIRKKDGSYALFLDKGGVVNRNETGKPLRITGIVIDVSDQ